MHELRTRGEQVYDKIPYDTTVKEGQTHSIKLRVLCSLFSHPLASTDPEPIPSDDNTAGEVTQKVAMCWDMVAASFTPGATNDGSASAWF